MPWVEWAHLINIYRLQRRSSSCTVNSGTNCLFFKSKLGETWRSILFPMSPLLLCPPLPSLFGATCKWQPPWSYTILLSQISNSCIDLVLPPLLPRKKTELGDEWEDVHSVADWRKTKTHVNDSLPHIAYTRSIDIVIRSWNAPYMHQFVLSRISWSGIHSTSWH